MCACFAYIHASFVVYTVSVACAVSAGYADNHAHTPRSVSIRSKLHWHIVSLAHQCDKQSITLWGGAEEYCTCIRAYRKYE
jgi:hypothetical protein